MTCGSAPIWNCQLLPMAVERGHRVEKALVPQQSDISQGHSSTGLGSWRRLYAACTLLCEGSSGKLRDVGSRKRDVVWYGHLRSRMLEANAAQR